jgi:DNA-binding NtrC family response regulator
VTSGMDLLSALQQQQPIAAISDLDGEEQDGFHTMKVVADYQRELPMFMLTEGDPILMGATDAMQKVCGLTTITQSTGAPLAGELISFLFSAGRRAGRMRLVPV